MSIKIRCAIGLETDILIVRYKRGRQGSEGMSFLLTDHNNPLLVNC